MYKMAHYTETDQGQILAFMRQFSFATVTGIGTEYPVASHLPLQVRENGERLLLRGHLMRKTDHHIAFEKNENVLVIFQSPHAFINANWYENPAQASTVNYMAVHAKGKISFMDEEGTLEALRLLTDEQIGRDSPASFNNIPEDDVTAMLKAIVGFTIEVTDLQHVFKLSQNKNVSDQQNIIDELKKKKDANSTFIAAQMEERITKSY
jgi:transcriptional regulator